MNKKELVKTLMKRMEDFGYFPTFTNVKTFIKEYEKLAKSEPQKPVVPQYIAEWIEYCKKCSATLHGSINPYSCYGHAMTNGFEGDVIEVLKWIRDNSEIYARAWLDGYEVEKEKRYTVKIKTYLGQFLGRYYLNDEELTPQFTRSQLTGKGELPTFTRQELEETGFGWAFDCEGIEVEEVE